MLEISPVARPALPPLIVTAAVAFALAFMLAAAQTSAAATFTIKAERQNDVIDIRAGAMLNADATTAWGVLTDYDHYPEFIPDLHVSRVVARDGTTITVEQSGDAALWLFRMPIHVTFEINESPPNSLQSRTVAGSVPVLTSSYALTPTGAGVRLDYAGRIVTGFELAGHIEQMLVEKSAARQFRALVDEIERRSAAFRGHANASPY
jgi:ribosome-associated toxin RatA of RatAB toxin-antitoxin module